MFRLTSSHIILSALLTLILCTGAGAQATGPALSVDLAADRHTISPDIYGMNDNPWDLSLGREIRLPVSRWGGDATTRYNWQVDAANAGYDWYFMAGGDKKSVVPSGSADAFVAKVKSVGGKALLTIPVIDYVNSIKCTDWDCSFPVSIVGPQQKVNPYVHPVVNGQRTDAGNGTKPDGSQIILTTDQILRVHVPNSPSFQQGWIKHLIATFGTAQKGGVAIYMMDNEPGGWANTHRDIHPVKPTYQEIVDKTLPYAKMVKATDATAQVDGPGDFGWPVYIGDTKLNGGLGNAEYYLKRFHDESVAVGHRLLDYFDEHYYPTAQDGQNDAVRLESTRSLWDPTYKEKDWIGQWGGPIYLIPRMHEWVSKYYPGTKIAITEYNWGGLETLNGALTEADALGIFGRESLDLATLWGNLKPTYPAAFAFRMYRNYDGQGSAYGDTWVRSTSADQGRLAIYGAVRSSDHALTLIVINKTSSDFSSAVSLSSFTPAPAARVFRYSSDDLSKIVRQPDLKTADNGFTAVFPANSITLIEIPRR